MVWTCPEEDRGYVGRTMLRMELQGGLFLSLALEIPAVTNGLVSVVSWLHFHYSKSIQAGVVCI